MKFILMILFVYSPLVFSFGGRSRRRQNQPAPTTPERLNCVAPTPSTGTAQVSDLVSNIEQVRDHEACRDLNIGESRVMEGQNLNGVAQNYAIKRTGANRFEASFNLNFQASILNPQKEIDMQNKVRECFQGMRNMGASDSIGRTIDFKMYTPREVQALPENERPPQVNITLNDNMEPNAGNYHSDFDCATIVHEIMHLMGLHDEYHNRRRSDLVRRDPVTGQEIERIDWITVAEMTNDARTELLESNQYERIFHYNDCRAIIDAETLMKNHNSFFPQTMPQFFRCRCENDRCKTRFKNLPPEKRNLIQKSQFLITNVNNFGEYCSANDDQISTNYVDVNNPSVRDNQTVTNLNFQGDNFSFINTRYGFEEPSVRFRKTTIRYNCRCTQGETDCDVLRQTLSRIQDKGVFSQRTATCPYPSRHIDKNNVSAEAFGPIDESREFILTNDSPGRIPMFRNAYTEKMIYPQCESKAPKYQACTRYSYLPAGADCSTRPAYCGNSSWIDDID